MLSFKNRVVVITGAGQGLGLEYANFFAKRGANLVVNDFAKKDGVPIAKTLASKLSSQYNIKAIGNWDSVEQGEKIIQQAVQEFGKVDVLINNAGIIRDSSAHKMTNK